MTEGDHGRFLGAAAEPARRPRYGRIHEAIVEYLGIPATDLHPDALSMRELSLA
jgi:hypothetical protein